MQLEQAKPEGVDSWPGILVDKAILEARHRRIGYEDETDRTGRGEGDRSGPAEPTRDRSVEPSVSRKKLVLSLNGRHIQQHVEMEITPLKKL